MTKFFWLLSDKKTIRQISAAKYEKLARASTIFKSHRLIAVSDKWLNLLSGGRFGEIPLEQLKQVIASAPEIIEGDEEDYFRI